MERERPRRELERGPVRQRVREALRCPYCHDDVAARAGAVVCAGAGCGALYHADCWDELAAEAGCCALLACGSQQARPLGAAGYAYRFLRMLAAALLFPPRVVAEALRGEEGDESIARRALREVGAWFPGLGELTAFRFALFALFAVASFLALVPLLDQRDMGQMLFLLWPALFIALHVAFGFAVGLARGLFERLRRAFQVELTALGRAEGPSGETRADPKHEKG